MNGGVLFARNPDRVAAFYAAVLGLVEAHRDDDHIRLESPGFQLVVHRLTEHLSGGGAGAGTPGPRTGAAFKPVFFVKSLSAVRATAPANGGAMDQPDREWSFNGVPVCDGVDPEGNVVQFRETKEPSHAPSAVPISGIVAMIHVTDVERSAAFYRLFGLEIGNAVPRGEGPKHWAWLFSPSATDWRRGPNLMVTRSDRPLNPDAQDVLFYLYAADLPAVRATLLASGIAAGEICYPGYLPEGEFRVTDPDGYTLMIAQSSANTP